MRQRDSQSDGEAQWGLQTTDYIKDEDLWTLTLSFTYQIAMANLPYSIVLISPFKKDSKQYFY